MSKFYSLKSKLNIFKIFTVFLAVTLFGIALSSCGGSKPTNPINSINPLKNSNLFVESNFQDFNLAKTTLDSQNYLNLGYNTFSFYQIGGLNASEVNQLISCMSINTNSLNASYSTPYYVKLPNKSPGSTQNPPTLIFAPSILMFQNSQIALQFMNSLKNSTGANCFIKELYNEIDINLSNKLSLNSDTENVLNQYNPPEINILATGEVIPKTLPAVGYFNFLFAQQGRAVIYMTSFTNAKSVFNELTPLMQTYLNNIEQYYSNTSNK